MPFFPGSTLVMVDCSGSMGSPVGGRRSRNPMRLCDLAGFMAEAIARRCEDAEIVTYDSQPMARARPKNHSGTLLAAMSPNYRPRGGTNTWGSTHAVYNGHDRVIIITDEQSNWGVQDDGRIKVPVITWNLAGYQMYHANHGAPNRFLVSGVGDTPLRTLPDVVKRSQGRWPWEV